MYNYETVKSEIFKEENQLGFIKARDNAMSLLKKAGAFKMFTAVEGLTGDSWTMMAYIDRLVELNEISEITKGSNVAGQDRVFVKAK